MQIQTEIPIRHILFAFAVLIYAAFSSPTPEQFGIIEIVIFFCLVASVKLDFSPRFSIGLLFAAYGFSVPLLVSMVEGYAFAEIVRDLIPFLFLLTPILFHFYERENFFLIWLITCAGFIFSIRSLGHFGMAAFDPATWPGFPPNLLYLANSPEVLFSAVILLAAFFNPYKTVSKRVSAFFLSCIPLLAMSAHMQRASLLYLLFLMTVGMITCLWQRPNAALKYFILVTFILVISLGFVSEIATQLYAKTQMVGFNARAQEWRAVIDHISSSPMNFFLGSGWGAVIENPAVGGLRVSYTHSLISALLLKTGVCGLIIFVIYAVCLLKSAGPNLLKHRPLLYALAGPLLIGLSLYASYKSFGYGLLLLVLASYGRGIETEEDKLLVSQASKTGKHDA